MNGGSKIKYFISIILSFFLLNGDIDMSYNKLSPEEQSVIINGATERPGTGIYLDTFTNGVYTCKRCNAALYISDTKFKAHCGWPAFDQSITNAVTIRPDNDGLRTEIICTSCGGHLGHVFTGEGYTDTDTRHCVNSISMNFINGNELETAYFAGGCFWGVEHIFDNTNGVLFAESGYMGGTIVNPEYNEVCSGSTGHTETVKVVFNRNTVSFRDLAIAFFEIHDPTQVNGQGVDIGTQYRSAVFYTTSAQQDVTNELISFLQSRDLDVATEVIPADNFWLAEDYHQNYIRKSGAEVCHFRVNRFTTE